MKTKIILLRACILTAMVLAGYYAPAQQAQNLNAPTVTGKETATVYTYKLFQAPNSMYGYDIFRDGKIVFHQGASVSQPSKSVAALSKKEHADQAALIAIEKIKKNQPAILTQEEIKKITIK
jgi:hypothetical protein